MPDGGKKYLIDADVLARIRVRQDWESIYKGLIELAKSGKVRTVRQVFDELKRHGTAYSALREYREIFQLSAEEQFDPRVSEVVEQLGNHNPRWLWEQTGGKNPDPADPFLVAVAKVWNYALVTNESPRAELRIPAACKSIGAQWMRGPHFLFEVKLVETSQIKFEHIDPTYFFDPTEGN